MRLSWNSKAEPTAEPLEALRPMSKPNLRPFHGANDCPFLWLSHFRRVADFHEWLPETRVARALIACHGKAESWANTYRPPREAALLVGDEEEGGEDDGDDASDATVPAMREDAWPEFCNSFLTRFRGPSWRDHIEESLVTLTQREGEAVVDYAERAELLVEKANVGAVGDRLVRINSFTRRWMKGLRTTLRQQVFLTPGAVTGDFQAAVVIAKACEEAFCSAGTDMGLQDSKEVAVSVQSVQDDAIERKKSKGGDNQTALESAIKTLSAQVQNLQLSVRNSEARQGSSYVPAYNAQGAPRPLDRRCFRCGDSSHVAAVCPEPPVIRPRFPVQNIQNKSDTVEKAAMMVDVLAGSAAAPMSVDPEVVKRPIEATPSAEERPRKRRTRRSKAKKQPPREIRAAKGFDKYNVARDLFNQQANITLGQLFSLSPAIRREIKEGLTLEKKAEMKEALLTENPDRTFRVNVRIDGNEIGAAVLDGGAMLNLLDKQTFDRLGLRLQGPSDCGIRLADGGGKSLLGKVVCDVQIGNLLSKTEFNVLDAKEHFPALLGKPWLRKHRVRSDWETDRHVAHDQNGKEYPLKRAALVEIASTNWEDDDDDWDSSEFTSDEESGYTEFSTMATGSLEVRDQFLVMAVKEEVSDTLDSLQFVAENSQQLTETSQNYIKSAQNSPESFVPQVDPSVELVYSEKLLYEKQQQSEQCSKSTVPKSGKTVVDLCRVEPTKLNTFYVTTESLKGLTIGSQLSLEQKGKVEELLLKYGDVFADSIEELSITPVVTCEIPLLPGAVPFAVKNVRRLAPELEKVAKDKIDVMAKAGLIVPDDGPWSSQLVFAKKKLGGWRMCHSYCKLNDLTEPRRWPIPDPTQAIERLAGSRYFSTLDGFNGYYAIRMEEESAPRTAFITPWGKFRYVVMPQGLVNAPFTFAKLNSLVFGDLVGKGVEIFFDDNAIGSESFEAHMMMMETVLSRYRQACMSLNPQKCSFFVKEAAYLGHRISYEGVRPEEQKLQRVREWQTPKTVKELQSFLGFCNFYRKFVPMFSSVAAPLYQLTRKKMEWLWSSQHQLSFEKLKHTLDSPPVLKAPNMTAVFYMDTDASNTGVGIALSQEDGPVSFYSRRLSQAESRYSTTEQELLAIVTGFKHYRCYLLGNHTIVVSDHAPLRQLIRSEDANGRVTRWLHFLAEYSFEIRYKAGHKHLNADALSRLTIEGKSNHGEEEIDLRDIWMIEWGSQQWLERMKAYKQGEDLKGILTSQELKWLNKKGNRYHVVNDILKFSDRLGNLQTVISSTDVDKALEQEHDKKGHPGIRSTLVNLQEHYHWPTMVNDARDWVVTCAICQKFGGSKPDPSLSRKALVSVEPFELIAMDYIGPLQPSTNGYTGILNVVDVCTRWIETFPVHALTSENTIKCLIMLINRFGTPRLILSDGGKHFTAERLSNLANTLGIRWMFTPSYSPSSNGIIERSNQELCKRLKKILPEGKSNQWHDWLPTATFATNTRILMRERVSPFMLLMGFVPSLSNQVSTHQDKTHLRFPLTVEPVQHASRLNHLDANRDQFLALQIEHLKLTKLTSTLRQGDSVLMYRKRPVKYGKFTAKWQGPFEIGSFVGHGIVQLIDEHGVIVHKVHVNRLKIYKPRSLQQH